MRRVEFDPDQLDEPRTGWLAKWQPKAELAFAEAHAEVAAGRPPDVERRASTWRSFKTWLLAEFFHEKCGYCEGELGAQSHGEAEHWRPKAGGADHSGYWWLAFSWHNLVPACQACNGPKGTAFPIAGTRVTDATVVDASKLDAKEQPLLLHPFRGEDPASHIGFLDTGHAYAKEGSALGEHTIRVLKLNRHALVRARAARQLHAREALAVATSDFIRGRASGIEASMDPYTGPAAPYSRAVNEALAAVRVETAASLVPG